MGRMKETLFDCQENNKPELNKFIKLRGNNLFVNTSLVSSLAVSKENLDVKPFKVKIVMNNKETFYEYLSTRDEVEQLMKQVLGE